MRAEDSWSVVFEEKSSVVPALRVTGFERSAVGAACALLLKRIVPALIVSRPNQVFDEGPVVGTVSAV